MDKVETVTIKAKTTKEFHKKFREKVIQETGSKRTGEEVVFQLLRGYVRGDIVLPIATDPNLQPPQCSE